MKRLLQVAARWLFAIGIVACDEDGGGVAPDLGDGTLAPDTFTVTATVTGLLGSGLVLQNGNDSLAVTSNGTVAFAAARPNGTTYNVTIASQPSNPAQTCAVTNGSGTINGSDVNVAVVCTSLSGAPALTLTPTSIKTFHFTWADVSGETEYRLMEDPDGTSTFTRVATIPADTTSFDLVVSLPRRVNASYRLQACDASGCIDSVAVSVVPKTAGAGKLSEAVGYVKPSNAGGAFGCSVAVSADGNTLAVGTHAESGLSRGINGDQTTDPVNVSNSGAVYVFTRASNNVWTQQAYIKASNAEAEDHFGYSVALSSNGDTLAVGAPFEDSSAVNVNGDQSNNATTDSGAAYVFTRSGSTWSQQAYVKAFNTGLNDNFGWGVALSGDGDTLAVSAIDEDSRATGIDGDETDDSASNSGAVYLFIRNAGVWSRQAYAKASNTDTAIGAADTFGDSIALSADGNTLAVGATGEDGTANTAHNSGAVYVFVRTGGTWSPPTLVKGTNTAADDWFGAAVGLSGDGNTLAVGAIGQSGGTVHVFTRSNNAWTQQQAVKASNATANSVFGFSVALSTDGTTLAVGAQGEDSGSTGINGDQGNAAANGSGAAYVFTRNGTWSQRAYVKAPNTGEGDSFGYSIALSANGDTLAVGAAFEASTATGIGGDQSNNMGGSVGAVYLY